MSQGPDTYPYMDQTRTMLSVIIPAYNARSTIELCLQSLERQREAGAFEVIVVDSSTDGAAEIVAQKFPNVRLYTCADRKFPGEARNIGIAQARGDLLAFTDADCVVDEQWVATIRAAHAETSHPAIGGAVANGNPTSYVGWGYYFCEFSQWLPYSTPGHMVEIPTCCLSLKRWAFDAYGPFLTGTYCSDTALQWKLGQAGHPPLFLPTIQVAHLNPERLGQWMAHAVQHGRAFAAVRVKERRWPWRKRLGVLSLLPGLPLLVFARVARRVWQNRRYRRPFLRAAPLVLAGLTAWSWGEGLGYGSK